MEVELEEGQIVLCTVEKIIGTTVFVKIEGNGEGTIITSEISPGRIRNLRDYVEPGKKIVCKVLSIKNGHIHLSLRRVKPSEKRELLNKISQEKGYKAILSTVLGKEKAEKVIEEITEEQPLLDFFEELRKNSEPLKKYVKGEEYEKIIKILESKKSKPKEIKQLIHLFNKSSNGIKIVKNILTETCKNKCSVSYVAAGRYLLKITGEDFKELKNSLNQIIEEIEKKAEEKNCEFSLEKK